PPRLPAGLGVLRHEVLPRSGAGGAAGVEGRGRERRREAAPAGEEPRGGDRHRERRRAQRDAPVRRPDADRLPDADDRRGAAEGRQGDRVLPPAAEPRACAGGEGAGPVREVAGIQRRSPLTRRAPVAFVYHEDCLRHSNGPGHPERPARLTSIRDHLKTRGLLDRLLLIRPDPCPLESLARVHDPAYVEAIRRICERAPARLDPDTGVSPGSWEAALLSAGGALAACDAVAEGRARAAGGRAGPPRPPPQPGP